MLADELDAPDGTALDSLALQFDAQARSIWHVDPAALDRIRTLEHIGLAVEAVLASCRPSIVRATRISTMWAATRST
jgi:hypothetical protein